MSASTQTTPASSATHSTPDLLPRTLLHSLQQERRLISFPSNHLRTLYKNTGMASRALFRLFDLGSSDLGSPKPFGICTYRHSPRFTGFWPKSSSCKSHRIRTYRNLRCNCFRIRTYEKTRGRGDHPTNSPVGSQTKPSTRRSVHGTRIIGRGTSSPHWVNLHLHRARPTIRVAATAPRRGNPCLKP